MSDKSQRLFVSYAHQDKALVSHVVELLRAGGHIPWSDHQLVAGQHWKRELREEIKRCDVFIYVLTPKSVTSEWCQWEFYEALKLGKPVVPVMMRKASLTDALNYIQHVDFTGNHESRALATAQLIRAVNHAQPTLIGDEISLNYPDPSGPPEYLIGTAGFVDTQAGLPTNVDEDTQSRKTSGYMSVSERQSARGGGKRPPLFWWGIIALVAVIVAILIRSGTLIDPPIPHSTDLTEVPTSIIIVPTVGFTDTAIIETPETQIPAPQPSVVSSDTNAAPTEAILLPTADATDDTGAGISTPIPVIAQVTAATANIRSGPGSNFRVIQITSQGDQFTVVAQSGNLQSDSDWLLIELSDGTYGWIWSNLVSLSDAGAFIPLAATLPATPRPILTPTPAQICNPGQWIGVCGSNNCGSDYVSQCNTDGTGYTCIWNPQQCTVDSGPGSIFKPPHKPTPKPGDPTEEPFVCTNSWLTGQLQAYANQLGISLQQLIQQLLPSYDLDHDNDIDCDDYNAMN